MAMYVNQYDGLAYMFYLISEKYNPVSFLVIKKNRVSLVFNFDSQLQVNALISNGDNLPGIKVASNFG
jgi:hypothetical protein